MSRGGQAFAAIGGALGGFFVGLVGGRLATSHMQDENARSAIVLASTVAGTAAGAGITVYATSKHLALGTGT
jgi:NhaP-type Na+/H+ or K+/H+ antiporter